MIPEEGLRYLTSGKDLLYQGVPWKVQPDDPGFDERPTYRCVPYKKVAVVYHDPSAIIFRGWCVLANGCGIHDSANPDLTLEECLAYGNRYAALRCGQRLEDARRELAEAERCAALIDHIKPL